MNQCPLCGSGNITVSPKSSRENKQLNLIKCANCNYRGLDLDYKEIYIDGTFSEIAREGKFEPDKNKIAALDRNAYKRFAFYKSFFKSKMRVLELGSSAGSMVDAFRMAGIDAEGLEPDSGYASFSKKQYGFEQYCNIIENFNTEKKYDLLCSFHVIEHVDNPEVFIKNHYRLLSKGGRILIECPSWEVHSFGDIKHTIWEPHRHYFSRISIHYLLSKYFTDIKTGYYNGALYATGIKSENEQDSVLPKWNVRFLSKCNFWFFRSISWLKFSNKKLQLARNLALISLIEKGRLKKMMSKAFRFSKHFIKEKRYLKKEANPKAQKPALMHYTLFKGWGNNAGDLVLSKAVRDTLNISFNNTWDIHNVHSVINDVEIEKMNKSAGIIVGGGGLFLPDTNKNTKSHWQWPINISQIESINKPLIAYAIGYNYFHGQEPSKEFVENLEAFIKKSDFIGLRNTGSINAVNSLLDNKYVDKIRYQPCPTTILSRISNITPTDLGKNIAVNIALDRYDKRFGKSKNEIFNKIGKSLYTLHSSGYNIFYAAHLSFDKRFLLVLDRLNIPYQKINLHQMLAPQIVSFYAKMDLVIGMRGHAQMIPFGVNTMILTLGTHNKMKWFLEDINASEWYIDVKESDNLESQITEKVQYLFENRTSVEEKIYSEQEKLYSVTQENLEIIKGLIS